MTKLTHGFFREQNPSETHDHKRTTMYSGPTNVVTVMSALTAALSFKPGPTWDMTRDGLHAVARACYNSCIPGHILSRCDSFSSTSVRPQQTSPVYHLNVRFFIRRMSADTPSPHAHEC